MDEELRIYSGGGDIKINRDLENKNLSETEKKIKRLKERIRVFTEELERLEKEKLEKDVE